MKNGGLLNVGKSTNSKRRLFGEEKIWLPDMNLIAIKPFWNTGSLERELHSGLAQYWYSGEWHRFTNESDSEFLFEGFREF